MSYQTRTAPTMMKMSHTSTSACGIVIQRFWGSSVLPERSVVGEHVEHRLLVGERHRHRSHQHAGGVLRVGAADARLELLERDELVPVAAARERRCVQRLVAFAVRAVARGARQ